MKIKHFLYNAFVIEDENIKIAIDPGKNLGLFDQKSLIPREEWQGTTHIFATHGDPDHHEFATVMAQETVAAVFCGEDLVEDFRTAEKSTVHAVTVDQSITLPEILIGGQVFV